jgi:hypothetical protein
MSLRVKGNRQRDCGVRGEAQNSKRDIFSGSLINKNAVIGSRNPGPEERKEMVGNAMFGGKQKGLCPKSRI